MDLSKINPAKPENCAARTNAMRVVRVLLIILMLLMLLGCRTTEVTHLVDQPTARHTGQTDTLYVRELPHLVHGDTSAPIRITRSLLADTLLPSVELVGITMARDAVAVRTRTDGIVTEHTYRSVRAAGETQIITPDTTGQLQASVSGTARMDTVRVMVSSPPAERPVWRLWWFGPVLLIVFVVASAIIIKSVW